MKSRFTALRTFRSTVGNVVGDNVIIGVAVSTLLLMFYYIVSVQLHQFVLVLSLLQQAGLKYRLLSL